MEIARSLGADRFRYCDTLGILDPFSMYENIRTLRRRVPELEIEVHTHNDLGMATANAIAGIRAGARFVNTTVNGLGERAGNAALEEVVMALKHSCRIETADRHPPLCRDLPLCRQGELPAGAGVEGDRRREGLCP